MKKNVEFYISINIVIPDFCCHDLSGLIFVEDSEPFTEVCMASSIL